MAKTSTPFFGGDFEKFAAFFDPTKFGPESLGKFFPSPVVTPEAVANAQRKNFEAFAKASKLWAEGAQAVAQRQVELTREAFETAGKAASDIAATDSVEGKLGKQADLVKKSYEAGVTNLQELAEMSTASNRKAGEVLNARMSEGLGEFAKQVQSVKFG